MQEHFKVQRRIEEKNIIKEHWRPHNENGSQKEKRSQCRPWPQCQGERREERIMLCCRVSSFHEREYSGAFILEGTVKSCAFRVEIQWALMLHLCGMTVPPNYMEGLAWANPCWHGTGKQIGVRQDMVRLEGAALSLTYEHRQKSANTFLMGLQILYCWNSCSWIENVVMHSLHEC